MKLQARLLAALCVLAANSFISAPANAASLNVTLNCTSPTNLTAAVGDSIRVTFQNCSAYNLYGGNGNGMFLNPAPDYQNTSTALWGVGSTGWSSGSRTWNLKFPADGWVIDFVLVGSANNGQVLIGPGSNLLFDSTKNPIFWWRTATVTAPTVTPAITPSTQSINATYGAPIVPTSALTPSGMTQPITYYAASALPAGLTLNSSTGVISGTIATGTSYSPSYTIRAVDANLAVATTSIAFAASASAIAPTTQSMTGNVGTSITASSAFTASSFAGTVTYSVSPALPSGLTLNAANGVITGTPTTEVTSANYTITGTDGTTSAVATVNISVGAAIPAPTSTATPTVTSPSISATAQTPALAKTGFESVNLGIISVTLLALGGIAYRSSRLVRIKK